MLILLATAMFSGMAFLVVKKRQQEKAKAVALAKAKGRRRQQRHF